MFPYRCKVVGEHGGATGAPPEEKTGPISGLKRARSSGLAASSSGLQHSDDDDDANKGKDSHDSVKAIGGSKRIKVRRAEHLNPFSILYQAS